MTKMLRANHAKEDRDHEKPPRLSFIHSTVCKGSIIVTAQAPVFGGSPHLLTLRALKSSQIGPSKREEIYYYSKWIKQSTPPLHCGTYKFMCDGSH